jgi:alpha-1,6-mannosyltransferase
MILCGLPVLGVAGGGVAELVDTNTGLLAESGSSASLAEGIRSLFSADLLAMGRSARQKAVVHYGWDCIMPQLIRHYETLLGSGQARLGGIASSPH